MAVVFSAKLHLVVVRRKCWYLGVGSMTLYIGVCFPLFPAWPKLPHNLFLNASTLYLYCLSDTATQTPPPPLLMIGLSLRNMSNPFGNTSDAMMLLSRWLDLCSTYYMSGWCSCSNEAKSSRLLPVERRLQQINLQSLFF